MTSVSLAAADEACLAIVDRINAGEDYTLDVVAQYSREIIDPLEEIIGLRVDVEAHTEHGQSERLDGLDTSQHTINVWLRAKVPNDLSQEEIDETVRDLAWMRAMIVSQLDNWDSSDRRVRIWDTENEDLEQPVKQTLRQLGLFVAKIVLHVEVEQ